MAQSPGGRWGRAQREPVPASAAPWGLASLPCSLWKRQQRARGAGEHPRVGRGRRGCNILFPSPLPLPWKSAKKRLWAGSGGGLSPRERAPTVPPGEGSPVVTASWVALAGPCIPGPIPLPDGRLGMVPPPLAQHSHTHATPLPKSSFGDAATAPEVSSMLYPPAAGFPSLSQGSFPSWLPLEPKELDPD